MNGRKKLFENPPSKYRSTPLWVWNDLMTEELISFQLKELKTHGFGGAFVHPRPGLVTQYLSEEWFRLWNYALEIAKELDLKLFIYDENSYPSGFAGGHVSSQLPDCLTAGMTYQLITDIGQLDREKSLIKAFACVQEADKLRILEDITLYSPTEWSSYGSMFFVVLKVNPLITGWLAGFSYVDVMRPEVTKLFLETTYEAYFDHFGNEFGKSIPAIFTDEPNISSSGVNGEGNPALPFSFWLVNEFQKLNGYSLLDHLPCVFREVKGTQFHYPAKKVRYDYYTTLHTLWIKNTIEPIGKWCDEHNIAWTGHYMEHQWPFAYAFHTSPSLQSHYEYHQWPAIDMLLSTYLRDTESHALMVTIQEIRSAANQFKKERTLCELYGAGGWDSTFEDYKRMSDWVMVNGINFINQHLTYGTIAGARKRDHPQSFDWREPWWEQYTQLNDYLGRVSYLLSQGVMEQRILLLNPTTTGYLIPYEDERGSVFSNAGFDAVTNPDMRLFLRTVQYLTDQQWDYDLGDEYTMKRHAVVKDGKLIVGEQGYDTVVVSGDMKNMLASTADLLDQFMKMGGSVIACGNPGSYIEGSKDETVYEVLSSKWTAVETEEQLHRVLFTKLTNRIQSSKPWATGVSHMRRVLEDGSELYFFVNHSKNPFDTRLSVSGRSVSQWNLFNGRVEPVFHEIKEDSVVFHLNLKHNQSAMFVIGYEAEGSPEPVITPDLEVPLSLVDIQSEMPNLMPISYCDLKLDGKVYHDIYVLKAADILYGARGFDGNPWDNKVQFKNNLMDRNQFGLSSGFEAVYTFTMEENFIPDSIYSVAEQPTLCRLLINGKSVEWLQEKHFLDHNFGMADIKDYVQPGENKITLKADRFDVRLELETIYLQGDFSVEQVDKKWVVSRPQPLQYGVWKGQGLPFYSGAVLYQYEFMLDEKPRTACFDVRNYQTTAISLTVNGQSERLIGADGDNAIEIADLLQEGRNEMTLRVCGSLKNLLGPHFLKDPVRGIAGPHFWKEAPTCGQPSPEDYDLLEYGLAEEPVLLLHY